MTNRLRLLDIRIRNYPLFEEKIDFSLLTSSCVARDKADSLNHLYGNNYTNNLTTIVGKNATGKTTIMKLEMGILYLLFGNKSISETGLNEVLFDNSTVDFDIFLYGTDSILIKDELSISQVINNEQPEFVISKEKIYTKKALLSESKKNLLNFKKSKLVLDRNNLKPEVSSILSPDDSLFKSLISSHKYQAPRITDNTIFTNPNRSVSNLGNVPTEILNYLDSSIEYLKKETIEGSGTNQVFFRLKFKGQREISDGSFSVINSYLSSGTTKGISLYTQILSTLKDGGIIFVDEIENHFNHAITRTFLNYFKDPFININNAKLIFTTHYPEFLDDLDRNDQIYIARRFDKISLTRYSSAKVRSDILKSDVFMSSTISGTAPEYDAYMDLKKATIKSIKEFKR
ncbi:AAA family ATPase [Companilactobacillus kimchii]|nr:ATP-binding protein [Companilactobacillus kimchii]KAE9557299.1 abortive infection protein [Companilactobacillus kimchii]KAE9559240.1 abortive infection protein [Companilactobacillus kimchii]OWF33757.1 hypothetical protein LKACC12383_00897 [Companilactobacillus kimchii]GEO47981.1 hypothetical protein LKI01_19800 [Companilactobacillus paralimentarius]